MAEAKELLVDERASPQIHLMLGPLKGWDSEEPVVKICQFPIENSWMGCR